MAGLFERSVLGLDVGSHGIKAVELRVSPRQVGAGQFRVHPRIDAAAPLDEHLRRFLGMHHLPTDHVAVALPAEQVSTRRLEFPFSDARRLAQAIPFEIEAETPFDLEDIVVDWNVLAGDRNHGVVAATLAAQSGRRRSLEALPSKRASSPRSLEAEGLVLANLAPIFRFEGTHLIADIGHEKTTFCAVIDGRPALARSVPVAGRAMTEALASELGLSFEDAEQQKCEGHALGRVGGGSSPGVEAILDRLAREAIRTLEAAEARHGEGPVAREAVLTLVGGSARLDGIDLFLARRTGLEAHRLRMPADSPHVDLAEGIDPVLFAPALALALRLSGEAVTRMNFRQGEFAPRQDFAAFFGRELRRTPPSPAMLPRAALPASTDRFDPARESTRRLATRSAAFPALRRSLPGSEGTPPAIRPAPAQRTRRGAGSRGVPGSLLGRPFGARAAE